jgi:hypothetical protein
MKPTKKERRTGWLAIITPIGVPAFFMVLIPIWKGWPFKDAVLITLLSLGFLAFSYYLAMSEDGD